MNTNIITPEMKRYIETFTVGQWYANTREKKLIAFVEFTGKEYQVTKYVLYLDDEEINSFTSYELAVEEYNSLDLSKMKYLYYEATEDVYVQAYSYQDNEPFNPENYYLIKKGDLVQNLEIYLDWDGDGYIHCPKNKFKKVYLENTYKYYITEFVFGLELPEDYEHFLYTGG